MSFLCGSRDCRIRVSGIYCDQHKTLLGWQTRETFPGQKVRFMWHGVEREAIVLKVNRTTISALIELKNKRRKTVRVRKSDLLGSRRCSAV